MRIILATIYHSLQSGHFIPGFDPVGKAGAPAFRKEKKTHKFRPDRTKDPIINHFVSFFREKLSYLANKFGSAIKNYL